MQRSYLRWWLTLLTTFILMIIVGLPSQAAKFQQPRNQVYAVTYINATAYQTKHQLAFFNAHGHVAYVAVEDFDANGDLIVDNQATTAERRAPQLIHHYLTQPAALNHAASRQSFTVKGNHRVIIHNQLINKSITGKVAVNKHGFTISYPTSAKVPSTVQFKLAPAKYQKKQR